jgi:hypothetical protein
MFYQEVGKTRDAEDNLTEARKYQRALVNDAQEIQLQPWIKSDLVDALRTLAKLYADTGRASDADAALAELRKYDTDAQR